MLKKFQDFAIKGNAFDLAVGVIIGAAFGGIVASLVGDAFRTQTIDITWPAGEGAAGVAPALQRICRGLGISESDLIVGMRQSRQSRQKWSARSKRHWKRELLMIVLANGFKRDQRLSRQDRAQGRQEIQARIDIGAGEKNGSGERRGAKN